MLFFCKAGFKVELLLRSLRTSAAAVLCAAAQSSELGRRHGDNQFVLSVVEPRLMRSTPSAPRGALLLKLLCLQNTQLGHASAEGESTAAVR